MFHSLNHDEWAAFGQYLDPISLYQLSCTCMGLHKDISSNNALWRGQALRRWPALFEHSYADTILDWYGSYRAAHKASCRLSTDQPWTSSITSTRSNPAPRTAHVVVANTFFQAADSSSSSDSSLAWQSYTYAAAAFGSRLHFWKWTAQADLDPPFVVQGPQEHATSITTGDAAESTPAAAAGPHCQHCFSDTVHNHSTGPVNVMIHVPIGGMLPGFATGSTDSTIKLWLPFSSTSSSSSSRSVGTSGSRFVGSSTGSSTGSSAIRACRTLTGHTDCVTALACLNSQQNALGLTSSGHISNSSSSSSRDSSGGIGKSAPILVSGSADKSIKLWSLASIQQGQGAPSSSSSSGGRVRQGGQKQQQKQQQARNPLLCTLHGHSGTISSLLAWPAVQSTNSTDTTLSHPSSSSVGRSSSCTGILSGSRDGRVKLWDVSGGRRSCVGTWRLTGPCRQLLGGLDMPGCAVVMLERSLQVLDTRVASTGSAVSQGVLTLPWPSRHLTTAAVRGNVIAAGGREGVRAWDLRMPPYGDDSISPGAAVAAGGSSSSSGSKRLLLSGSLPNKAHVSHLHLDALKLVATSSHTKLHCAAGIAVWSLPDGNKVELPSSCLSGINLHPTLQPYRAASKALNCTLSDAHAAIAQLIDQLSETQAEEAVAIRSGEVPAAAAAAAGAAQHQHNMAPAGEGSDFGAEGWGSDGDDSVSYNEHGWNGNGLELFSLDDHESTAGFDDSSSDTLSHGDHGLSHAAVSQASRVMRSMRSRDSTSGQGCIEPGVLALGVHGPVIACIDSLGNFMLRDFTSGVPGPEVLQAFAVPRARSNTNTAVAGHCPAVVSAALGDSNQYGKSDRDGVVAGVDAPMQWRQQVGSAQVCTAQDAAVAAVDQLSKLRFWRQ